MKEKGFITMRKSTGISKLVIIVTLIKVATLFSRYSNSQTHLASSSYPLQLPPSTSMSAISNSNVSTNSLISSTLPSLQAELTATQTFSNSTLSFDYPREWKILDDSSNSVRIYFEERSMQIMWNDIDAPTSKFLGKSQKVQDAIKPILSKTPDMINEALSKDGGKVVSLAKIGKNTIGHFEVLGHVAYEVTDKSRFC